MYFMELANKLEARKKEDAFISAILSDSPAQLIKE